MKQAFWDKLIQRLDRVDPGSLQLHLVRLARERGFLETLFQSLQEGIAVLDDEGVIRYLNRATQELAGIPPEAALEGHSIQRYLLGVDWEDLLGPGHGQEHTARGAVTREMEVFYPRRRFLSLNLIPVGGAGARDPAVDPVIPVAYALILRDVTEARRKAQDVIEKESLSAIHLLSAGVAHELGNPLNSLGIHLQLMERELARIDPAVRDELVELVHVSRENVTRLDQIITRFLQALRPTVPQLQPVPLARLIEEVLRLMGREIESRGVRIEMDLDEHLPAAEVDPDQIKQALFNVVKNAVEAIPDGGLLRVVLQWDQGQDRAILAIIDSGIGIPPDSLSRVFDPYWTSKPEGTGLGLMIVHRIVTAHGGEIEVHSVPGQGTEFRITLPLRLGTVRLLKPGDGTGPSPPGHEPLDRGS